MKAASRLSLRMRITLLTGVLTLAASLGITAISMYNVQRQFMSTSLLEDSIEALTISREVHLEDIVDMVDIESAPMKSVEMVPLTGAARPDGTTAAIVINALPAPILAAKRTFDYSSILYLLPVCAAGMAAAYIVAGRALRPVRELMRTAERITEQSLAERIPETGATDEIGGLTRTFNAMLGRLEQSFTRQKNFSANVAHELKTPLATMNAGIQVLRLDEIPTMEDALAALDTASRGVKRLSDVVDNLFLLTDEAPELYTDIIQLDELFSEILAETTPLYLQKTLKIVCDIEMGSILGNRALARHAFFNLAENAMKYSGEGGTVTIRASEGKISVINTGQVIPPDDLERVFEPFYRADPSRSRKTGGAGLGLSIVKSIVEKHGWTVTAKSEPGQETVIEIDCSI